MPKVVVLLATYNGEKYILEQLKSLANQTYEDFTCYIHDDGSTDATVSICVEFCRQHKKQFFLFDYPKTGGARNNFFSLIDRVDADYVFFCDQDDIWKPDKMQKMLDAARKYEGRDNGCLTFCDLKVVDEKLNIQAESFYRMTHAQIEKINYKNTIVKGYIPGCALMIDKVLLDKARRHQDLRNIIMHDWWIVAIAYLTQADIVYLQEPLVLYRQHAANAIGAKDMSTVDRIRETMKRFVNGNLRAIKKEQLESPRRQAEEIFKTGLGSLDRRVFVDEYSQIGKRNKLRRIVFYVRNIQNVHLFWWMLLWV